tara:strand:+ start:40871 stop:42760 length:1890 start_codon:yes stop_codon:yes gene_type:complete
MSNWIILVNVAVYSTLVFYGVSAISPVPLDLIYWGGNIAPLSLLGQPWRLFTSLFMHGGLLHLALNMFMLFQIGILAEMIWGSSRFLLIYVLSGLFASLTSALWYGHWADANYIVSVGASGALMGISGACLVHSLFSKLKVVEQNVIDGESSLRVDFQALLKVVGINLVMGFAISGVDNACHVGGLVSGMLIAFGFLIPLPSLILSRFRSWLVVLIAVSGLSLLLRGNSSERLESAYQSVSEELSFIQRQRARILKIKAYAEMAELEKRSFLPGVSRERAEGKKLSLTGGEEIVFNEKLDRAYLTDINSNALYVVDIENLKVIKTIQGQRFPKDRSSGCSDNLCRGQGAAGVAVNKGESWAIVTSMVRDQATFVNLVSGEVEASISLGRFPRDVFLSPDETRAFVINGADNSVSVIDVQTKSVLKTIALDSEVDGAAGQPFGRSIGFQINPLRSELYAVNATKNEIAIIDIGDTNKIIKTTPLADFSPSSLQLGDDGQTLWVVGYENFRFQILVYDVKSWSPVDRFKMCRIQQDFNLALSPDGQWFAVNDPNLVRVFVVSRKSLKTVRIFPGSATGVKLHFSRDSRKLYGLAPMASSSEFIKYDLTNTLDVSEQIAELEELVCLDLAQE